MVDYSRGLNYITSDIAARSYCPPEYNPGLPQYRLVGRESADVFKNKTILDPSNQVLASFIGDPARPIVVGTPNNNDVLTYNGNEWVNLPAGGGGGSYNTGNTIFVDAVYGNDATGQPFSPSLPYRTCGAAATAAAALPQPALIYVRAGNYTESNLARAGTVYWYFDLGAVITSAGTLFDISAGTFDVRIWGRARFVGLSSYLFLVTNQSGGTSTFSLECLAVEAVGCCISIDGSTVSATISVVGTIQNSRTVSLASGAAELIDPINAAVHLGATNGAAQVNSLGTIVNTGGGTCVLATGGTNWTINAVALTSSGPIAILTTGGALNATFTSITTAAVNFAPIPAAIGAVAIQGGTAVVTTDTIFANGAAGLYSVPAISITTGSLTIDAARCTVTGRTIAAPAISMTGGTLFASIGNLTTTSAEVANVAAGEFTLRGTNLDASGAAIGSPLIIASGGAIDISIDGEMRPATNGNGISLTGGGTLKCSAYSSTLVGTGHFLAVSGASVTLINVNITNCAIVSGNFVDITGSANNSISVSVVGSRVVAQSGALINVNRGGAGSTGIFTNIGTFTSTGALFTVVAGGSVTIQAEIDVAQSGPNVINAPGAIAIDLDQYICSATTAFTNTGSASLSIDAETISHTGTRIADVSNGSVILECNNLTTNGAIANLAGGTVTLDITSATSAGGITQSAGTFRGIIDYLTSASSAITLTGGTATIVGTSWATTALAINVTSGTITTRIGSLTSVAGTLSIGGTASVTAVIDGGQFQSGDAPCYLITNTNTASSVTLRVAALVSARTDVGTTKAIIEISGSATINQQTGYILGTLTGAHCMLVSGAPRYQFAITQLVTTGRVMTVTSSTQLVGRFEQIRLSAPGAHTAANIVISFAGAGRRDIFIGDFQHLLTTGAGNVTLLLSLGGTATVRIGNIIGLTYGGFGLATINADTILTIGSAAITGPGINIGSGRSIVTVGNITMPTAYYFVENSGTTDVNVGTISGSLAAIRQVGGQTNAVISAASGVSSYVFDVVGGGTFVGSCQMASGTGLANITGVDSTTSVNISAEYFSSDTSSPAIEIGAGNVNVAIANTVGKFENSMVNVTSTAPTCITLGEAQVTGGGNVINIEQREPTTNTVKIGAGCVSTESGVFLRTFTYRNRVLVDVVGFVTNGAQVMNITGGNISANFISAETKYEREDQIPIILATTRGDFGEMTLTLTCGLLAHIGTSQTVTGIQLGDSDNRDCTGTIQLVRYNNPGSQNGAITSAGGIMTVFSNVSEKRLNVELQYAETQSPIGIYLDQRDVHDLDGMIITGVVHNICPATRSIPVYIQNDDGFRGPSFRDIILISDGNFCIDARTATQNIRVYGTLTASRVVNNSTDIIPGLTVISNDVV